MRIEIPDFSLVVLIGVSGSGKSSLAARHFAATEVLSSDVFRGLVADDENDQAATPRAFDALYHVAGLRLAGRRLTVVDATNVQPGSRAGLVALAKQYHALPVALVLDMPQRVCQERNKSRGDRGFGPHVIPQQASQLRRSLSRLRREGFRQIEVLKSPDQVDALQIERVPLWPDRREERGPFDIIGDIHGCFDELLALLDKLGYRVIPQPGTEVCAYAVENPAGRRLIFVGDLVDRGPKSPEVLELVQGMVAQGQALCVAGNHEVKLLRKLSGRAVKVAHGLAETLEQLEGYPESWINRTKAFMDGLISHYVLDEGRLVVAHAGLREDMQNRASGAVRSFALYGDTSGEIDEFGLPVRHDWAREYRGDATVVYGHTPVPEAEWLNGTICIDTGCVFGGKLSALRYPENELVEVPALAVHCEPTRPLDQAGAAGRAQLIDDGQLYLEDVAGKRIISAALRPKLSIQEENAQAALEVMSRFAIDPRWLIYLPPTMAPPESSSQEGYLEHPSECFAHFRKQGVSQLVCQQKHMGSRALLLICRRPSVGPERFGVEEPGFGVCYTRTGRPFFKQRAVEQELLQRVAAAATAAGLFDDLDSDWLLLDAELMPWSHKARELLRSQYAATAAAGELALAQVRDSLRAAAGRGLEVEDLLARHERRQQDLDGYREAYRGYCWPVQGIDDLRIAPFHLLASEGAVHADRDHIWHMQTLSRLHQADAGLLQTTRYQEVHLELPTQMDAAIQWWQGHTAEGGEGMVLKPREFVVKGRRGLVQPALKCRGQEYLRIIYGPDYLVPANLNRLRRRSLARKRSLALREFALGLEALHRFVRREPLRRVHECVFGVLALESEPVDPRL